MKQLNLKIEGRFPFLAFLFSFICLQQSLAQCPCATAPEVWSQPVKLTVLQVGGRGAWATAPWVTTGGDTMYLLTGSGIYCSIGHDTIWTTPIKLNNNINRSPYVQYVSASPDGKRLYLRDYGGGYGGWDIWESDWSDSLHDWGLAKNLGPNVNTSGDEWTAFTPDDSTLYVDHIIGSGDDLRLSRWSDSLNGWGPSVSLEPVYAGEPPKFNCWNSMNGITMTGDQKRAYFSFYDQSGAHAEYDLFVSYYDSATGWGAPLELNINSHPADTVPWYNPANLGKDEYPSITADGKWLYFDSNRTPDSSFSIYVSHLVIDRYGDSVVYTGIKGPKTEQIPSTAKLFPGYPNPFNPSTVINYQLSSATGGHVTLKIFDILGREVRTLVNERETAGQHVVHWDGTDQYGRHVASGVYFIRLSVHGGSLQEKVVLVH